MDRQQRNKQPTRYTLPITSIWT